MFDAIEKNFSNTDVLIKAAAPADFKPKSYSDEKIKKDKKSLNIIEMTENVDIAKHFGKLKSDDQIIVGFAAESSNEIENAKGKLKRKNFDLIVVNNIKQAGAGFKQDTNIVSILDRNGKIDSLEKLEKIELADIILNRVRELF